MRTQLLYFATVFFVASQAFAGGKPPQTIIVDPGFYIYRCKNQIEADVQKKAFKAIRALHYPEGTVGTSGEESWKVNGIDDIRVKIEPDSDYNEKGQIVFYADALVANANYKAGLVYKVTIKGIEREIIDYPQSGKTVFEVESMGNCIDTIEYGGTTTQG